MTSLGINTFGSGSGPERFARGDALARRAEAAGFASVWVSELYNRSAVVPMATIMQATSRVLVGTNIAYGVGRTPLVWAAEARDLDELSSGRLVLGLGNGTAGMMENWHGVSGDAPAVRMEELVTVLRKLWRLDQGPVHHDGRFYTVHLDPTADTPPPRRERLPIYTAGVNPRMIEAAGRVADGLFGHPMFTARYLDDVVRPALAKGAAKTGRDAAEIALAGVLICAVDDDVEAARRRLAYAAGQYAASRVYDRLFALHGWTDAQQRIREAARARDAETLIAAVPDAALEAIGIACRPEDLPAEVARHAEGYDHLVLTPPPWGLTPEQTETATEALIDGMRAPVGSRLTRRENPMVPDTLQAYETLTVERPVESVLVATLNRPERMNAMTDRMFAEFEQLAREADDPELRALIITGAGRAFCAGFDLDDADGLAELAPLEMLKRQERAARSLLALRTLPIPVIAAVNGAAAGGGLALALAADIRLGSPAARFNAAFVRIGLSAGDLGTSWLLPRLIGPARAAEFAYTGGFIEADEAERTGLLNRVVPDEHLLDAALELAGQIAQNSPGGVQLSKRALQANLEASSFAAALELENRGQALLTRGADMPEALAAFKEKRAPRFTGA